MTTDRTRAYAQAVVTFATADDALDAVEDELLAVARAVDSHEELRQRLTDIHLPVGHRLALLESDVLNAAHPTTRGVLAMLIAGDRVGELTAPANDVAELAAASRNQEVAEVTVAVELDDARRQALSDALERATGRTLDVKFVVDPSIVGGVRARIGDTVIDGTVVRRLDELRTRAAG
ncbi:MAG: ATP synthase F1 subunit delta [Nitriliruptoraceae bacterium]